MNTIEQRHRALAIIREKLTSKEETLQDYTLDSICRQLLGLPGKPADSLPYVGWMVGEAEETQKMKISSEGVDFIKRWEGFRNRAYKHDGDVWTIGYGHTHGVKPGMVVTKAEAEEILARDLEYYATAVTNVIHITLSQKQFDALVSFTYNVGVTAFKNSTLVKKLNQGMYHAAAREFERWVRDADKVLAGLVRRREAEKEMFLEDE